MKLIALEAATEACSAALNLNGEIFARYEVAPRAHTEKLLPMLESLLAETGLALRDFDALAFGRGPGSFTGVRIATAAAQGIAFGADLPVIPVSTLAGLAQRALDESGAERVLAAIDARMSEVYWGVYRRNKAGLAVVETPEMICPPDQAPVPERDRGSVVGAGTGWRAYGEALRTRVGSGEIALLDQLLPDAAAIARLGAALYEDGGISEAEQALPVYLRDKVASRPSAPVANRRSK